MERDPADTRARLRDAAEAAFAEHGFERTTIAMIAKRAGANIAAVNYHYGSKGGLYAEFVAAHLEAAVGRMPVLADNPADPRGQLGKFVAWFLDRCRPGAPLKRFNRDFGALTPGFLEAIFDRVVRREVEACEEYIRALLPPSASPDVVRHWCSSMLSLCTSPLHGADFAARLHPDVEFDDSEFDAHTEHVTAVIRDGLAAESRRLQATTRRQAAEASARRRSVPSSRHRRRPGATAKRSTS